MNVNPKQYILLAGCCILVGLAYYAWQCDWFEFQSIRLTTNGEQCQAHHKCKVTLSAWRERRWIHEHTDLIWANNEPDNAKMLLQTMLGWLLEEKIITKKVTVEAVMPEISGQELIVDFDKNPLSKNASAYDKVMCVEAILKTLRENGIKTPFVRFIVNHEPMIDQHLDFSVAWPLEGLNHA